ncbi:hypothetical protein [Salinactinospora qingdaonensis]|uniref:FtsX-like permease family protein n=1 Tax=Salinactinospora qingdaonensis TaxID=702744 RepID=A0ABP7FBI3_9ACTN
MRVRLVCSSVLIGVLSAFVAWALHWAVVNYQDVTYEMPGTVTTLRFAHGPHGVDDAEVPVVLDELRDFIDDRSLALVIGSAGQGYPQLVVADPEGVVPWYAPARSSGSGNAAAAAHVFEGTYSQQQWLAGRSPSLVPDGVEVVGTMVPPEGSGDVQFVRTLGDYRLPPGDYVVTTTDPAELAEFTGILHRAGFEARWTRRLPFTGHLTRDPVFGATVVLLGAGCLAAALFWTLGLRVRAREFAIRRRHGATRLALVRQVWLRGLAAQAFGIVVGVALSGALVALAGREVLGRTEYLLMSASVGLGLVLAAGAWLAAAVAGTWARNGAGRAS